MVCQPCPPRKRGNACQFPEFDILVKLNPPARMKRSDSAGKIGDSDLSETGLA